MSDGKELATYCGNEINMEFQIPHNVHVMSPNNNMLVRFHSDFSNEEPFRGFLAHYRAEDIDECAVENGGCQQLCHNFVSGYYCSCRMYYELQPDNHRCTVSCRDLLYTYESDEFQTPDYPQKYPNDADCNWVVRVESGFVINFVFQSFALESHPEEHCPYDYVTVHYDGTDLGPYCGESQTDWPPNIVTSGHEVNVTFHSDNSEQRTGFHVRYYVTARPCPSLAAPAYGSMIGSNFTFKQSVTFLCKAGYSVNGSSSRTCQGNGTWSGTQPFCQIVTCDTPPPIGNGRILFYSGSNFSYTNSIGYECDRFYELHGMSFRECQANATWSFPNPTCVPICGESSFDPREHESETRIVGGREAVRGSWPWQALVKVFAPNYDFLEVEICGGSLLNEEWVLTAAHCVTGGNKYRPSFFGNLVPTDAVEVGLGIHNRKQHTPETLYTSVQEIIKYSEYDAGSWDSDVALLRLNQSVQLTDYIRPICLPEQNRRPGWNDDSTVRIRNVADGEDEGVVIGWGQTGRYRSTSNVLREVNVGVNVPRDECNEAMNKRITRNMVCAGPREGGRDACFGDSGGPLMLRHATTGRYFPYGMVSWGDGCGEEGKFGVYARIENFVNWIKSVIEMER
ncbi:mannan-binding lectin serine protease 1-like [Patiria miniata]|uniref:Uncharacterized protein n=1 Tax=Patiria miniata TaxID=46514 RepID=A0A914AF58_PATMI|nr:mannan-binding lectin serine protease 1-like [Patiria miniata]